MLPGTQIKDGKTEIVSRMLTAINPVRLSHYKNIYSWKRVNNGIYEYDWLRTDQTFYLLYSHPVHDYMDKLFCVEGDELLLFMKEHIDPYKMEGIDIVVSTSDFSHSFVCNHDGEIYLASTSARQ